ncbi:MAG: hypothetical protein PHX08_13935 [Lachnospiraceae bacterium]|nr:hypothetical protein [Lachnospiraceae bacterium]
MPISSSGEKMNSTIYGYKKIQICNKLIEIVIPDEFILVNENELPEMIKRIAPDDTYFSKNVFLSFKSRKYRSKEVEENLKELYLAMKTIEHDFNLIGVWKKEIDGISMGRFCYSAEHMEENWYHTIITYNLLGRQYYYAFFCLLQERELWEDVFQKVAGSTEWR